MIKKLMTALIKLPNLKVAPATLSTQSEKSIPPINKQTIY